MKTAYQQAAGKSVPMFTSTSVWAYSTEQRQFIEFAKGTIRSFYETMENTAKTENPNTLFGALVDTYWVYPETSDDTQPYDYYATVDEVVYEWFYAIQDENWAGITDGLQRIKNLNPSAKHYFIYGTATMTTTANMRKSVQLTMAEGYDGVFLYEYAKSKSNPFDVSDIVSASSRACDINGDGVVDLFDALLLAQHLGSKQGDPDWDPTLDMNGDGEIDVFDVIVFARNYG
jgi:hypothetical protein